MNRGSRDTAEHFMFKLQQLFFKAATLLFHFLKRVTKTAIERYELFVDNQVFQ